MDWLELVSGIIFIAFFAYVLYLVLVETVSQEFAIITVIPFLIVATATLIISRKRRSRAT